jgi:hypothetical protein
MRSRQTNCTLMTSTQTPPQHECTVAVAEDPFVRRYVRSLLVKHGFQIVENDARLTRQLMESGELKPDVLITNAPDAFADIAAKLPVVYLAAAPDPALVEPFRLSRMLRKPFQAHQLLEALSELTAGALP